MNYVAIDGQTQNNSRRLGSLHNKANRFRKKGSFKASYISLFFLPLSDKVYHSLKDNLP